MKNIIKQKSLTFLIIMLLLNSCSLFSDNNTDVLIEEKYNIDDNVIENQEIITSI